MRLMADYLIFTHFLYPFIISPLILGSPQYIPRVVLVRCLSEWRCLHSSLKNWVQVSEPTVKEILLWSPTSCPLILHTPPHHTHIQGDNTCKINVKEEQKYSKHGITVSIFNIYVNFYRCIYIYIVCANILLSIYMYMYIYVTILPKIFLVNFIDALLFIPRIVSQKPL